MDWVNTAILSTAIMAVVNILDSHLLSKRMPSLQAFLLPVGIIYLACGCLLLALFPLPQGVGTWPVLAAVASGILRTAAAAIMLDSLRREEVSRVVPVVYTYPIFVAIMATALLGESLRCLQWLAIIIVVAGAVLVSMTQGSSGSIRWRGRLLILFSASLLFGMADIAAKYALAYISFWNVFCLSAFSMSGLFLSVSVRPQVVEQVIKMERRKSAMGLLAFDATLAPVGTTLAFWALERGPVSLVSTIISSRPMFVLVAALILSRLAPMFLEWRYGKWPLAMRVIATAMIVSGIVIIHLV